MSETWRGDPPLFPPRRDPNPEHTYTIEEAREILAREECCREGHVIEQNVIRSPGRTLRVDIHCSRCKAVFREVAPDPTPRRGGEDEEKK